MKLTGKSVISYTKSDGLCSDAVMSITQDHSGYYYFGTYDAGVTRWQDEGDSARTIIYNSALKNSTVWITEMEGESRCWVGSSSGIDLIETGRLISHSDVDTIDSKVRTFLFVHDSLKFIGGSDGVMRIEGKHLSHPFNIQNLDVNKLILADETLYMATTTGLFQSDLSGNETFLIALPENNVKSITTDHEGNLWIGTNSSGIFFRKKDGGIFPFELDRTDAKSKTILGLITDSSGNIWAATLNGVYQVVLTDAGHEKYKINHYGRAEGLITLECNQNAIFEDRQHYIWVGNRTNQFPQTCTRRRRAPYFFCPLHPGLG